MWLESRFRLCPTEGGVVALGGGESFGAPFLAERLKLERRVAWFSVDPSVADDAVALGNRLAEAVNKAVGGDLLQHALPYLVHLRTLALRGSVLSDLSLVISGADHSAELVSHAVEYCRPHVGLWIISEEELPDVDADVRLGKRELRLSIEEARALAPTGLSQDHVNKLLEDTCGAYTMFLRDVNRAAGLPEIVVPTATGEAYTEQDARLEDPSVVLEALVQLERWRDALEIAVEHFPLRVEDLLTEAGPAFQSSGLLTRLHLLLSLLPSALALRERTLEWRLLAAHQVGEADSVLPYVRRHLQQHEAPTLRSRFAAFLPYKEGLEEAARAASSLPSPLTLWQYGRMHEDAERGVELLTQSIRQAEIEQDPFASARSAASLAARFNHLGRFQEARIWAEWGLQVFDESRLQNGTRRLHLLNDLAFARTMLGDTRGLKTQLEEQLSTVENVLPSFSSNLRLALADLYRTHGESDQAAELTRVDWETASRGQKGLRAYHHVRSLLGLRKSSQAIEVAQTAVALSAGVHETQDLRARLALGMAQAFVFPESAKTTLLPIVSRQQLLFEQRAMAALHYLLAKPDGFGDIPEDIAPKLQELGDSALRVLSGPPEVFHPVWSALRGGKRSVLELKTLGDTMARLEGAELKLTKRQWEILVALAMHPNGLTYESLHAFLLHDMGRVSVGTLRSHVSHLRDRVPISDNPYRIEVPFNMDALEVHELLEQGKIREAIALVGGPLLPRSTLPGIRDMGEQIEQEVRESVLSSGDPEALYSATSLWEYDLEVWERSLESLHPRDPRVPLLRARVNALREEFGAD